MDYISTSKTEKQICSVRWMEIAWWGSTGVTSIPFYHSAYAAVLPEAAGRGIFSALYAAAEDKARELGIHVIELSVGQMNQKVIDIHKSHGYEIERVIMKKLV